MTIYYYTKINVLKNLLDNHKLWLQQTEKNNMTELFLKPALFLEYLDNINGIPEETKFHIKK